MSIEILRPGVEYYAERIARKDRFAFVRYGEGDLQVAMPGMSVRPWIRRHWSGWTQPGVRKIICRTLTECHVDGNYLVGLWHLDYFVAKRQIVKLKRWLETLSVSVWHDGGVFKDALERGELGCVIQAMREQRVVLVGPGRLAELPEKLALKDCRHVGVHPSRAFLDWPAIAKTMMKLGPALFALSAGVASKVLIHHLWPRMPDSSFVDFGAVWDGLCGYTSRQYHHTLTKELIEKNLHG